MKIEKTRIVELLIAAALVLFFLMLTRNYEQIVSSRSNPPADQNTNFPGPLSSPDGPFYGMHFVEIDELAAVKALGVEVVLRNFAHDGPMDDWLTYLDAAHSQGIKVVAWLWPQGWQWNGQEWEIDAQAELFIRSLAGHPALMAVYALHEPYWRGCVGCGYTTAEQQALYTAIKEIAEVPVWSAVDSMSFWTAQGTETAFAAGICDYCLTWYYPFREDGTYEREKLIARLLADLNVARTRAPEAKIVWNMQVFAQGAPEYLRMPTVAEMRDLASIVYTAGVDGALWYPWNFNELYTDFLSQHPELHSTVREIYDTYVQTATYLPVVPHGDVADVISLPPTIPPQKKKDVMVTTLEIVPPDVTGMGATAVTPHPFYGIQFVGIEELATVKEFGIEVVLRNFAHDGTVAEWLAYLDAAQAQKIRVVAWLWPEGWRWNGTEWEIDAQAELFIRSVAGHPALLAVYALHEPYWQGCMGCGYSTATQQALYTAIKTIADVPVWSAVDSMSFWSAQGEETAFAGGICDYCETWYYPFKADGRYEREEVIARLAADLAVARERAPEAKIVWILQGFAQGSPENLRMPTAEEMRDLAAIVYAENIDGALWYPWNFNDLYTDYLSNHPELYPVIGEIFDSYVLNDQGGEVDE